MDSKQWAFWIDRGGTFTDVIARRPDGRFTASKYLSENPERYKDAAVFAMREIMGVADAAPFPSAQVDSINMGTTGATNALLEREGEPTLLLINRGFKDALLIGQQHREGLFDLKPRRPQPLYDAVCEVTGRMDANGKEIEAFDVDECERKLQGVYDTGLRAIAIVFMHGYRAPDHEIKAAAIASEIGFTQISMSHQASPLIKIIPRGDTTIADAYLSPILHRYARQIQAAVGDTPLYFMQSHGGLANADHFDGKDAILSGPAGGIVGAAATAKMAGETEIIGFDMGGTSTDVSHYAGTFERTSNSVVAGVKVAVPMMDIHTVAAGGGSICSFKDGRLQVGPASAGAHPGPAAYAKGGPLTVTDCNALLGKLQPALFPSVFGRDGKSPLDIFAAKNAAQVIINQIASESSVVYTVPSLAEGFIAIANEHMARAIRKVSVERGHDIKRHALLTFGGAGGQHTCGVADALGITRAVVPPFSGVLSALGMGLADLRTIEQKSVTNQSDDLDGIITALTATGRTKLISQGVQTDQIKTSIALHVKYSGSDTTLAIADAPDNNLRSKFEAAHQQAFGFTEPDRDLIIESIEVESFGGGNAAALTITPEIVAADTAPISHEYYYQGAPHTTLFRTKETLKIGEAINGPAVILEGNATTVIDPGWSATRDDCDNLRLARISALTHDGLSSNKADPVMLEVFNNLFMSVAEEMGAVLANTAQSVNVKERLDFSCAVFDTGGNLVANAPHMPVHLGSMGDSVIAIIDANKRITATDVFMVNDPYAGGTHLPDITVVSPVFIGVEDKPSYYVASRGHHADIGGITPGSMPPNSTHINEEGIRFTNFHLVKDGTFQEETVRTALNSGDYPSRNTDQNIADLKAQIAANKRGSEQVIRLVHDFTPSVVSAYMGFVRDNAEMAVRAAITKLKDGSATYPMDCGATIAVKIKVDKNAGEAIIDFTGTSPIHDGNFNAPLSVTKAAVLYVFRCLAGSDIPLNAGCLAPLKLIVPEGCMLNPIYPAAVVAGNVETSQAVTNALFIATNTMASAQGTMNNLTFGDDTHQYYETIAGGTGAGDGFDGTDAIQSHMTNSRLTDPEILEWRYPVYLRKFAVRDNSGGAGKYSGGNGLIREIEFIKPMQASILSGHRTIAPPGLNGGKGGKTGITHVIRTDGTITNMAAADSALLNTGDILHIETPGGGGYGKKNE